MLPHLLEIGRAVGFDSAAEAAQGCRFRGVPCVLGWGSRLPFADGTFGTVTAFDVIEHIEDDLAALGEVFRVLRPGGLFVATVPAYQFMWSRHDVANHHFRRYRCRGLRRVLTGAGLCIVKLSYYNMLLFPAFLARVGLIRLGRGQLPASDLVEVAAPVNGALKRVMFGESHLIRWFNLPLGASLICVARRPV
jgi:SAM-dependent methyltransferase